MFIVNGVSGALLHCINFRVATDPACGTGGMLSVAEEYLHKLNASTELMAFGQEINDQTFAICKADMLIKGNNADFIKDGNTLSDDQFEGQTFDYILSINWTKKVIKFKSTLNKNHICKNNIFLFNPLASDHLGFAVAARSKYNLTLLPQQSQDTMIRQGVSSRKRLRRM